MPDGHLPILPTDCANCSHPSAGAANGFGGEHFVAAIAHYMHSVPQGGAAGGKTLQELGFQYINMDASWDLPNRTADGKLQPDPRLWPSGLEATVKHVHSLNLGFGLYGDRGSMDCANNPGNEGHEVSDAQQYAAWEIDWYKTDSCHASGDPATAIRAYARMRDALNATGRPIWLALCGWKPWYAPPDPSIGYGGGLTLGNSWRTGDDTGGGWTHVVSNIVNALAVARWAGPSTNGGGWNDGSLQLTPGMGGGPPPPLDGSPLPSTSNHMDVPRFVSMYSAWSILALNLLLTGNFSGLSPVVLQTWSNPEVLSINQDPLGSAAFRLNATSAQRVVEQHRLPRHAPPPRHAVHAPHYTRATMAECGGEPALQQWSYNASGLGEVSNVATGGHRSCLNVANCQSEVIYDGCSPAQPFGCGSNEAFTYDAVTHTLTSHLAQSMCLTEDVSKRTLTISPCEGVEALGEVGGHDQWFAFNDQGQLVDKAGLCLTASAPPPPPAADDRFFIGRRLGGGAHSAYGASPPGYAVMLLNNDVADLNVTCAAACLGQLGIDTTDASTYAVRDVVRHTVVGTVNAKAGRWLTMFAKAGGGSQLVRLSLV
jgi:hypothetical protein